MTNTNSTWNETSDGYLSRMEDEDFGLKNNNNELIHLRTLMVVVPIVVPTLFSLVIIIGFIGNLLVVLVVILNKKMRTTTNILIFNLAVSGLLKLHKNSIIEMLLKFAAF